MYDILHMQNLKRNDTNIQRYSSQVVYFKRLVVSIQDQTFLWKMLGLNALLHQPSTAYSHNESPLSLDQVPVYNFYVH